MRPRASLVGAVVGLVLAGLPAPTAEAGARPYRGLPPPQTVSAWAIRVHDGDTFSVGLVKIRLRGIDAPELGAPLGRVARRRLAEILGAGPVTIVPRAEDVYGRVVADVYVGGHDVADILRREGLAKPGRASR
jgi:endonuclease YncB( thermonuclease family)